MIRTWTLCSIEATFASIEQDSEDEVSMQIDSQHKQPKELLGYCWRSCEVASEYYHELHPTFNLHVVNVKYSDGSTETLPRSRASPRPSPADESLLALGKVLPGEFCEINLHSSTKYQFCDKEKQTRNLRSRQKEHSDDHSLTAVGIVTRLNLELDTCEVLMPFFLESPVITVSSNLVQRARIYDVLTNEWKFLRPLQYWNEACVLSPIFLSKLSFEELRMSTAFLHQGKKLLIRTKYFRNQFLIENLLIHLLSEIGLLPVVHNVFTEQINEEKLEDSENFFSLVLSNLERQEWSASLTLLLGERNESSSQLLSPSGKKEEKKGGRAKKKTSRSSDHLPSPMNKEKEKECRREILGDMKGRDSLLDFVLHAAVESVSLLCQVNDPPMLRSLKDQGFERLLHRWGLATLSTMGLNECEAIATKIQRRLKRLSGCRYGILSTYAGPDSVAVVGKAEKSSISKKGNETIAEKDPKEQWASGERQMEMPLFVLQQGAPQQAGNSVKTSVKEEVNTHDEGGSRECETEVSSGGSKVLCNIEEDEKRLLKSHERVNSIAAKEKKELHKRAREQQIEHERFLENDIEEFLVKTRSVLGSNSLDNKIQAVLRNYQQSFLLSLPSIEHKEETNSSSVIMNVSPKHEEHSASLKTLDLPSSSVANEEKLHYYETIKHNILKQLTCQKQHIMALLSLKERIQAHEVMEEDKELINSLYVIGRDIFPNTDERIAFYDQDYSFIRDTLTELLASPQTLLWGVRMISQRHLNVSLPLKNSFSAGASDLDSSELRKLIGELPVVASFYQTILAAQKHFNQNKLCWAERVGRNGKPCVIDEKPEMEDERIHKENKVDDLKKLEVNCREKEMEQRENLLRYAVVESIISGVRGKNGYKPCNRDMSAFFEDILEHCKGQLNESKTLVSSFDVNSVEDRIEQFRSKRKQGVLSNPISRPFTTSAVRKNYTFLHSVAFINHEAEKRIRSETRNAPRGERRGDVKRENIFLPSKSSLSGINASKRQNVSWEEALNIMGEKDSFGGLFVRVARSLKNKKVKRRRDAASPIFETDLSQSVTRLAATMTELDSTLMQLCADVAQGDRMAISPSSISPFPSPFLNGDIKAEPKGMKKKFVNLPALVGESTTYDVDAELMIPPSTLPESILEKLEKGLVNTALSTTAFEERRDRNAGKKGKKYRKTDGEKVLTTKIEEEVEKIDTEEIDISDDPSRTEVTADEIKLLPGEDDSFSRPLSKRKASKDISYSLLLNDDSAAEQFFYDKMRRAKKVRSDKNEITIVEEGVKGDVPLVSHLNAPHPVAGAHSSLLSPPLNSRKATGVRLAPPLAPTTVNRAGGRAQKSSLLSNVRPSGLPADNTAALSRAVELSGVAHTLNYNPSLWLNKSTESHNINSPLLRKTGGRRVREVPPANQFRPNSSPLLNSAFPVPTPLTPQEIQSSHTRFEFKLVLLTARERIIMILVQHRMREKLKEKLQKYCSESVDNDLSDNSERIADESLHIEYLCTVIVYMVATYIILPALVDLYNTGGMSQLPRDIQFLLTSPLPPYQSSPIASSPLLSSPLLASSQLPEEKERPKENEEKIISELESLGDITKPLLNALQKTKHKNLLNQLFEEGDDILAMAIGKYLSCESSPKGEKPHSPPNPFSNTHPNTTPFSTEAAKTVDYNNPLYLHSLTRTAAPPALLHSSPSSNACAVGFPLILLPSSTPISPSDREKIQSLLQTISSHDIESIKQEHGLCSHVNLSTWCDFFFDQWETISGYQISQKQLADALTAEPYIMPLSENMTLLTNLCSSVFLPGEGEKESLVSRVHSRASKIPMSVSMKMNAFNNKTFGRFNNSGLMYVPPYSPYGTSETLPHEVENTVPMIPNTNIASNSSSAIPNVPLINTGTNPSLSYKNSYAPFQNTNLSFPASSMSAINSAISSAINSSLNSAMNCNVNGMAAGLGGGLNTAINPSTATLNAGLSGTLPAGMNTSMGNLGSGIAGSINTAINSAINGGINSAINSAMAGGISPAISNINTSINNAINSALNSSSNTAMNPGMSSLSCMAGINPMTGMANSLGGITGMNSGVLINDMRQLYVPLNNQLLNQLNIGAVPNNGATAAELNLPTFSNYYLINLSSIPPVGSFVLGSSIIPPIPSLQFSSLEEEKAAIKRFAVTADPALDAKNTLVGRDGSPESASSIPSKTASIQSSCVQDILTGRPPAINIPGAYTTPCINETGDANKPSGFDEKQEHSDTSDVNKNAVNLELLKHISQLLNTNGIQKQQFFANVFGGLNEVDAEKKKVAETLSASEKAKAFAPAASVPSALYHPMTVPYQYNLMQQQQQLQLQQQIAQQLLKQKIMSAASNASPSVISAASLPTSHSSSIDEAKK